MGGLLSNIRGASCLSAARELSGKTKSVTVGIRASVATCGSNLEDMMAGSHVEEGGEQVRGKDSGPSTRSRKDKSRDAISSLEGRFVRLELGVADTKEGMDLLEQNMEKAVEDLKVQIQDLQEGMQSSSVHMVSHEEFMTFQDKVLSMLASLESRVEVLTKHEEELRQEVAIYKTALSARVMATHEAPRVEVPNPHTFSGQRDAMAVAESLMDYKESNSSDDEGSRVSHSSGGGEKVSPEGSEDSCSTDGGEEVPSSTARYGKGKVPYAREDKGRRKQRESAPKLKCFLCDGPHLIRECPKRKALSALIERNENVEEDARLGSIQMIGALQVMPKANPQGSEVGEQTEVASPYGDKILKGKEKSVGKKARHSRPRQNGHQQKAESSREKEVETILAERVTRKHGVPPMREYLVRWKGLPKRKTSWEREDALGKFAEWNRRFETAVSTGTSMAWVGESVTNSLSRPQHHMGRILPWAQESPSSPYLRRGNVLEPCGDFFDQSYVEGSRRLWRSLHNSRRFRRSPHLCRRVWNNVEGYGRF